MSSVVGSFFEMFSSEVCMSCFVTVILPYLLYFNLKALCLCLAKYACILVMYLAHTDSSMTWPEDLLLAKLQCERLPNKHLVVLQKQLVCVLHARMDLQGKFKPSSLFSAKVCFVFWRLFHLLQRWWYCLALFLIIS